jgi:hypothetical protein
MRKLLFAIVIAVVACHRAETFDAKPPRSLPDRMTAYKNDHPEPVAPAQPWMFGCYQIAGKDSWLPEKVELTSDPDKESNELEPLYLARLRGRHAGDFTMSSVWAPAENGVQITLSSGFVGWLFGLQKSQDGFRGTAQWFDDIGEHREVSVVLTKIACR